MGFVRFFIRQRLFVNLLSVAVFALGILALLSLRREAFPIVDLDMVVITAAYPGASPEEIEDLVTTPIEDSLKGADGIEEIESFSIDNRLGIVIKLEPDQPHPGRTIDEIRRLVDSVRTLPADMDRPLVTEITSRKRPVGTAVLAAVEGTDYRTLRNAARDLEERLKELPGMAAVERYGLRNREFRVELQPAALRRYVVGVDEVIATLRARNANLPVGKVVEGGRELILKTPGRTTSAIELERTVIRANEEGHLVRLSAVAKVRDAFEEPLTLNRVNGRPAILLQMLKRERSDTIEVIERAQKLLEAFEAEHKGKLQASITDDESVRIRTRLRVLSSNALIGTTLVLIVLFLFLNWRMAVVTGVGIPLAFALTFIAMRFLDYNLDLLTLLGLIVVVGMVVDDAIIVAENIYRHIEDGLSPAEAAVRGTGEVILPVAATILTTIAAFAPLLLMSGIRGRFAFFIAAVVILALVSSWLEAMTALPAHVADFARSGETTSPRRARLDQIFEGWRTSYEGWLRTALRYRALALAAIAILFVVSLTLIATRVLPFIPFPSTGLDNFMLSCRAPQGTELNETARRMQHMEQLVAAHLKRAPDPVNPAPDEELISYQTTIGVIRNRPGSRWSQYGAHYAIMMVNLTGHNSRKREGEEILSALRTPVQAAGAEHGIDCQLKKSLWGSNRGSLEVRLIGSDLGLLNKKRREVESLLEKNAAGFSIDREDALEKSVLKVLVPQERLAILGLDNRTLNATLRTVYEGTIASAVRLDGEEVRIRVIFPEQLRNRRDSLRFVSLSNRRGALIPLERLASLRETTAPARIDHHDWKQTMTIRLDPKKERTPVSQIVERIRPVVAQALRGSGVRVEYGGSYADEQETESELLFSLYAAMFFIFLILVTLFRSLLLPLIVMAAIPMAFVGSVAVLLLHGMPLSFMAGIGFIGLVGVAVNDSLVIVEFISRKLEPLRAELRASVERAAEDPEASGEIRIELLGRSIDAVVQGARLRFRAVLLTTFTTSLGLLPTAYGIGGDDPYIRPLAIVFAWALLFATFNTLILIPACFTAYLSASLRVQIVWARWKRQWRST